MAHRLPTSQNHEPRPPAGPPDGARTRRSVVGSLVGVFLARGSAAAAGGFKVVVHPGVPTARLHRAALTSAFLKKTERWPDGTPIVPVDQAHDSAVRSAFSREVLERSVASVDAYWQRQVFSGRATPPITKPTDADVLAFVRGIPGAIGYVAPDTEPAGVKEIRVE